jgi:soluble lytic murein transglycosylase-like protein
VITDHPCLGSASLPAGRAEERNVVDRDSKEIARTMPRRRGAFSDSVELESRGENPRGPSVALWPSIRFAKKCSGVAARVVSTLVLLHGPAAADPAQVCEQEMVRAARTHGVPLAVLYAIGLTETGRRGSLHPYALNIEGPSFFPATLAEASDRFTAARKRGAKLIDVGCMQINYRYHAGRFASPEEMFDPHANVTYAARFLKQLEAREGSWTLAAARYHAGPNNNPAQKRYVCQVITNMVASGFGSWTSQAQAFCR